MTYRNIFIVWAATGLWHGANWNYIAWGLYFGVILSIEKAGLLKCLEKLPSFFQHTYLLFVVLISWVLFAAEDFSVGIDFLKTMFGFAKLYDTQFLYNLYTHIVLLVIATIAATPAWKVVDNALLRQKNSLWLTTRQFVKFISLVSILLLATAYLVDESFNPFLYFRF